MIRHAIVDTHHLDPAGREAADVDAENRRTEYAYDKVGRMTRVILAAGTAQATLTTYAYDELGNQIAQTDAEGRTTCWHAALVARPRRALRCH